MTADAVALECDYKELNLPRIAHLKAIQVFDAVARTGNLTQAAEALQITQSAISYHIQILEADVGVKLFERTSRGVHLTEKGLKLVPYVREGLRAIEAGLAAIKATHAATVVRVAVLPMFASRWLAPRLGDFWEKHPKIELSFSHDNNTYSGASNPGDMADVFHTFFGIAGPSPAPLFITLCPPAPHFHRSHSKHEGSPLPPIGPMHAARGRSVVVGFQRGAAGKH